MTISGTFTWTREESDELDRTIIRDRLYHRARTIEQRGAEAWRYVGDPWDSEALQINATAFAMHEQGHTYESIGSLLCVDPGTLRDRAGGYYAWRSEVLGIKPRPKLARCAWCADRIELDADGRRRFCDRRCAEASGRDDRKPQKPCTVCGTLFRGATTRTCCSSLCGDLRRQESVFLRRWSRTTKRETAEQVRRSRCGNGHDLTLPNATYPTGGCKPCGRERSRRKRAKQGRYCT